jgi:hypothetical protein
VLHVLDRPSDVEAGITDPVVKEPRNQPDETRPNLTKPDQTRS